MANPPKKAPDKPAPKPKPRFGKGQPAHYCGKKGRSGPPLGNTNNLRHGLTSANLPKRLRYVYHRMCALRRTLEAAVIATKGQVSLGDAALIQTACRWERAAQLHEARYRREPDKYTDSPDKAAKASESRDHAVERLRLDRDGRDSVLDALYSRALPAPDGDGTDEPT